MGERSTAGATAKYRDLSTALRSGRDDSIWWVEEERATASAEADSYGMTKFARLEVLGS